ncbi:MAG: hypothetical protein AB7D43_03160 [Sulfurimonadaceae bacterium]
MADNVTTEQLELALQQLANQMGLSTVEYVQSLGYETVAEVQTKVNALQTQIDAIVTIDENDGVETLAEKIELLNALLAAEEGATQEILTRLTNIETAIAGLADIEARLAALETAGGAVSTDVQAAIDAAKAEAITTAATYTDANVLKASSMDICLIANSFRAGLGLALIDCSAQAGGGEGGGEGGDPEGDGLVI